MSVKLRDYQAEGARKVFEAWQRGVTRPGVDMATGLGKTAIMGEVARTMSRGPGRVCVLLHRDTLVEQTVARFREQLDPGTSIGVLKAERDELGARVIVASVHSLRRPERRRRLAQADVRTLIVDEAHVSVSPTYREVYRALGTLDGDAVMAGFSATWSRSDATGLGDVWQEIVYSRGIKWGVAKGFLVRPRGVQVGEGVDLTGVRRGADGDYRDGDLERAVMLEEIRDIVVTGALRHAPNRPGVLFAPTIDAAEYFAAALTEAGLRTEGIYASTPAWQRRQRFADHREGRVRILSTCTALAEGWDAPWCSAAHYVRPTRHKGLFVQTAGRVLRPWPGKADALLLDYVGVLDDMDLRSAVDLSVSCEDADGAELLEPDDDDEEVEPVGRERMVRRRRVDHEVELFAGTTVKWLPGPAGLPFVPCGDQLVVLVDGPRGWNVAEVSLPVAGRPAGGRWVAEGLSSEAALEVGSDHAEELGEYLSRRSAAWRKGAPSEAQLRYAHGLGIDVEGLNRGQVSDEISAVKATYALAPLVAWQQRTREHES